jgi:transposase
MEEARYIKHLWEKEEKSLRDISRTTGLAFQTVQKYAYMENWNQDRQPNVSPERYPVLQSYIPIINEWLEDDKKQPRKQRHTMTRIFHRLRDEHAYTGSYSSIKRYVRKKKYLMKQTEEGFLPLSQPQAHAQLDFGKLKYYTALGGEDKAYALTLTFPYSNMGFTQVFRSENQECLLEGMKRLFTYIEGVPLRIRTDNMTTAVVHVLKEGARYLSDGFERFMLHYRFVADFCNVASGHEKGNVENKVGYSRRNYFVPVPTIVDFEEYNRELLVRCERDGERKHYRHGKQFRELWEDERRELLPLPGTDYDVYRSELARVNHYGFITDEESKRPTRLVPRRSSAYADNNKYGVSPELTGQAVEVRLSFDRVSIYYDRALLVSYERSYGVREEIIDWKLYLDLLCKKPGAVEHTRFFDQLPKLWQNWFAENRGKERKSALMLLREIVQDGNVALCEPIMDLAARYGRSDSESIRHYYYALSRNEPIETPLVLTAEVPSLDYHPDLSIYDNLTGGMSHV